jgi:hypothetical protein
LARAWRGTRGTALRPALVWCAITLGVASISQAIAVTEPFESGRPLAGQAVYLATLAGLAALVSVLNARSPGGEAWAILMVLLVVIFLVPWLEGSGLVREGGGWDRLRLAAPWSIFYGLLVLVGVTNFLPTRFFAAATLVGLGFAAEYAGLTSPQWSRADRGAAWMLVPIGWAMAAWVADLATLRARRAPAGLPRLWFWFRDAWGVVWALRVQERFNRAAAAAGWPIRLTWHGVEGTPDAIPPEAAATLAGLLRRFATSERLREISGVGDDF